MTGQTLPSARTGMMGLTVTRPPRRRRRINWMFLVVGYGLPVTAAVLATLTWFSPGHFVASGDIPPFIRDSLASELTQSWSHQATGAGSSSAPILSAVEVVLLNGARLVGLDAPFAQWLMYALCFGLCAFGAAYLAGGWVRQPLGVATAGLLATFNPYLMTWLVNPLPALAVGLAGLWAGLAVRAAAGRRISPIGFAAATLPASYLALNPPWLLISILTVSFVVVGAVVVGGLRALGRTLAAVSRALPWMVLFNLWWIVPFAQQLLLPAGTVFSAVTDIQDWAWTHQANTVANVITLRALWAWNIPGIFSFSNALGSPPRSLMSWALPILALAGVVAASFGLAGRRRRAVWLVAAVAPMLLFLSTGLRSTHIGWINLWLYEHVPGMWLIRDPASKLGVPTLLLYAALAAIAVDQAVAIGPRLVRRWRRRRLSAALLTAPPRVVAAGLVLVALAYPSPMWTGSAVPDHARGDIPSFRVAVPDGWYRLADAVNATPGLGKVLMLPVNLDYYALSTNWGYRGVDIIPSQLLRRPTLHVLPGGYYDDSASVKALLMRAQDAVLAGDGEAWRGASRALGVDTVIVRHDLWQASFDLPVSAAADALDAALAKMGDTHLDGRFGVASLYRLTDAVGAVSAGGQPIEVVGMNAASVADTVADLPAGEVGITEPGQPVTALRATVAAAGTTAFTLAAEGEYQLQRAGPDASYRATVADDRLELNDADTVAVDGQVLPGRPPLGFDLTDPDVVAIDVDGQQSLLSPGGDVVAVGPHSTVTAFAVARGYGLADDFQPVAECDGTPGGDSGANPLRMAVKSGVRCAAAPVVPTPNTTYRVRFSFRTEGRATARVCLWQQGTSDCAPLPAPIATGGSEWTQYTAVTRTGIWPNHAWLYLYGDANAGAGLVEFRDPELTPLRPVGQLSVTPEQAGATSTTLAAGQHTVTVERAAATPVTPSAPARTCGAPASDSPYYRQPNRPRPQPDGSLLLDVQAIGGCAEAAAFAVMPGATYRLTADYLTYFGQTPKICLREVPSGRCADVPLLAREPTWQSMDTLIRPRTGTTFLVPQLVEYATAMVRGRVSFRNFQLTRVAPVTVTVTATDTAGSGPTVVNPTVVSASEYRVPVHGAAGRFTLGFADSYATGWALDGLPAGWSARHVIANGYANAWIVEGTGDAILTIRYRPAGWVSAALAGSILAAVVAAAMLLSPPLRRFARRRWSLPRLRLR